VTTDASCFRVPSSRTARQDGLPSAGAGVTTLAFDRKLSRSSRVSNDEEVPVCTLPWAAAGSSKPNDTRSANGWLASGFMNSGSLRISAVARLIGIHYRPVASPANNGDKLRSGVRVQPRRRWHEVNLTEAMLECHTRVPPKASPASSACQAAPRFPLRAFASDGPSSLGFRFRTRRRSMSATTFLLSTTAATHFPSWNVVALA
jgi:hypothetical protein